MSPSVDDMEREHLEHALALEREIEKAKVAGVQESRLAGEFDATVWAREFVRTAKEKPEIATDEGTMIGWFANAIMAGYDRGRRETEATRAVRNRLIISFPAGPLLVEIARVIDKPGCEVTMVIENIGDFEGERTIVVGGPEGVPYQQCQPKGDEQ